MQGARTSISTFSPIIELVILMLCLNLSPAKSQEEDFVKPLIHWPLNGNGLDVMDNLNIHKIESASFVDQGVNDSQALLFKPDPSIDKDSGTRIHKKNTGNLLKQSYRQLTFSFWFKALKSEAPFDKTQLLFKIGRYDRRFHITREDNQLKFLIIPDCKGDDSMEDFRTPAAKELQTSFTLEKWNHVAFRFNEGTITLFLNGKISDKDAYKNLPELPATKGGTQMGFTRGNTARIFGSSMRFHGLIDDIKFFDVALSDENIQNLFLHQTIAKQPLPENYTPTVLEESNKPYNPIAKKEAPLINTKPITTSDFQPQPEESITFDYNTSNEQMALPQEARKSAKNTRLILAFIIGILALMGITTICVMGYKSSH